jgi:hypothetical protein
MSGSTIIGKVAVKVYADTSDFHNELKRDLDRVEKGLKVKVSVDLDASVAKAAKAMRDKAQNALKALSLRVDFDNADSIERELKKIDRELSKLRETEVRVDLDEASLLAARARLEQQLADVKVKVKVDSDGLRATLLGLANIGASAAKFAAVGAAVGGIAALSLSAASNLAALSASLATLAPAALALPGLLTGIGLGLAATVLALKDFNTVLPDVKGKLSDLQDAVSENFWDKAKAPIREMIDTLLPQFASGMAGIATNLGNLFGDLATSLKSSLDGAIAPMFARLGESIEIARGATDGFADIIATLGQVGADYLPRLSQWMVDLTNRFSEFVTGAAADGRLKSWIDTGIQALRDLGTVVGGLGGIFYGIGTAAVEAGGSVLGTLGAALQHVSDVVNSPAFQAGLTNVFAAAHEALHRIATTSGPGVTAFFSSLGTLLPTLLPIIGDALGTALGAVATALSSVAVQTAVVTLFEAFRTAVELLAPVLTGLTGFLSEHTTVAKVLALVLGTTVVAAYTALAISSAVTTTRVVAANLKLVASAVATAAKTVASWASMTASFVAGTASLVHSVAIIVATYVKLAAQSALAAAKTVASWVAMAASAVASALVHTAQVAVMVTKWIFLGAQSLAAAARVAAAWLIATGPIGLVIAAVIGLVVVVVKNWDTIRRVTSDLWNTVKRLTGEAWEAVKDAVRTGISAVLGFFRAMPGQVVSALGNMGSLLVNAGRQVVDGFVRGITSAFGKVKDTLSKLTNMLPDWKGPASKDRVILKDAGRLVIGGLVAGMESQYGQVHRSLSGLTRSIGATIVPAPQFAEPRQVSGSMTRALAGVEMVGATVTVNKHLTYHAAPGSSLGAEEDLFAAASRTRMVGW